MAELQRQVDQQQPTTIDQVHKLVKDEQKQALQLQKELPEPRGDSSIRS